MLNVLSIHQEVKRCAWALPGWPHCQPGNPCDIPVALQEKLPGGNSARCVLPYTKQWACQLLAGTPNLLIDIYLFNFSTPMPQDVAIKLI
ncbi:hypothetical protein [Stenotrophomonas sp.]|uniref:hypothetical protein n=1 Tax=Stenotrophomonas sp. TaxID=69392 RepID=UPI0028AA17BF|nr:hypothetical protein [Stenotrophomonas sp.]